VKKGQNGRKSLGRLKPTVGCNASKGRKKKNLYHESGPTTRPGKGAQLHTYGVGRPGLMLKNNILVVTCS
jgi:hypothetical protein